MDRTVVQWRVKDGDEVMSADEQQLGKLSVRWPLRIAPTGLAVAQSVRCRHDVASPLEARHP